MEATYSGSKLTNVAQVGRWYFINNCRYIIKADWVDESSSIIRGRSLFEFDGTEAPTTGEWYSKGDYVEFSTWGCSEVADEDLICELEMKVEARRASEMKSEFHASPLTHVAEGVESTHSRAVAYAEMLLDAYLEICEYEVGNGRTAPDLSLKTLLNGADNWIQYSFGGSSLVDDADIAEAVLNSGQYQKWAYSDWEPKKPLLELQAEYLERGYKILARVFNLK